MASQTADAPRNHSPLGWLSVLINAAYAVYGYYGFAPPPGGMPTDWWHGRTFILDFESMGGYVDNPLMGAIVYALPAAVVCAITFYSMRSVIGRLASLWCLLASFLYAASGFAASAPWVLFSWRFTAALELIALSLAATLMSGLLVKSWLRYGAAARALIYLPIFIAIIAAVRGATGTSEQMAFMVSPWPIFTTYGLETGASLVAVFIISIALGLLTLSRGTIDLAAVAGLAIAIACPAIWIGLGESEITFDVISPLFLCALAAALIGACSVVRSDGKRRQALVMRGFHLGLGGVLGFVPIYSGHALAAGDYSYNRFVQAPQVIEALQSHIKKEEFYPEKLADLVEAGYLDEAPKPRTGFALLETLGLADEVKYRYNEYGSSFILEFDARFWVQCAYSGNYYFDEEEDGEEYEDEEPTWSCLDKSPLLTGGDEAGEEEYEDEYEDEY